MSNSTITERDRRNAVRCVRNHVPVSRRARAVGLKVHQVIGIGRAQNENSDLDSPGKTHENVDIG